MKNTELPYLVCGKFMYPQALVDEYRQLETGNITTQRLQETRTECLRELVRRQTEAGLKIVSDGCIMRSQWDFDFYFGLKGIEKRQVKSGHIYEDCDLSRPTPQLAGRICFNDSHPLLDQYTSLCSVLPEGTTASVLLPAPAHFLLWLLTQDTSWRLVYEGVTPLARDISQAYKETMLRLH